jgi:hypothetical protein
MTEEFSICDLVIFDLDPADLVIFDLVILDSAVRLERPTVVFDRQSPISNRQSMTGAA